ncbi:Translocation and assembly module TamA [Pseudidiomarina piscicola]|uniref:Translocation and assembly module subunit TamA n=1 Tax=Pseudidiomarina piscicola TaxID=2614830 RepID=A0A6S6WPB0_9GAMM|nr:autotransporter assembly complex family protein [Pseudidiomarina piscicola]CAB0151993.1 Translocation and assembly module TamA [Pseudidiomarina piscicola]VZT41431.1 Translocation and assembly module TamA [Pseudomonas aeruginosa]
MTLSRLTWLLLLIVCVPVWQPLAAQQPQAQTTRLNVVIEGVEGELAANVRSYLELLQYNGKPAPASFRLRFLARRGDNSIAQALEPFGYYHSKVSHSIDTNDQQITVRYEIEPGPLTTIASIDLDLTGAAQQDPTFKRLRGQLPINEGQPLRHSNYERSKSMLRSLAAERGYYDASFNKQEVNVELGDKTASIVLHFDSGQRYKFGDISICCNHLDSDFLARYFHFEKGEEFHTRDLLDLQVALASTDYFESVEVAPLWSQAEQQSVPISVRVTANERDYYQIGPGYGTDTGARLTLGFDRRWVNDRGHKLSSIVRLSEVQNTGFVDYIIPGKNPSRDQYSITGEILDRTYEDIDSTLYRTSLRDSRHYDSWQRTYQLAYQREDYQFGSAPKQGSGFFVPSAEFSLVSSELDNDNRNLIDNGYRVSARIQAASDAVLSDTSFVSLTLSGKTVYSLTQKWRFLARAEVGAISAGDFSQLPPSLRFFAGGDHSVRGYAYQQLGPENAEGVVTGGRYLAITSAEFDYLVAPQWRVAIFSDFGNTGMEWSMPLKKTIGIGARWLSPIGPVRLDVAQAIDEPDKPWRLHLTIGPDL